MIKVKTISEIAENLIFRVFSEFKLGMASGVEVFFDLMKTNGLFLVLVNAFEGINNEVFPKVTEFSKNFFEKEFIVNGSTNLITFEEFDCVNINSLVFERF
jgi:hypothetical protein